MLLNKISNTEELTGLVCVCVCDQLSSSFTGFEVPVGSPG